MYAKILSVDGGTAFTERMRSIGIKEGGSVKMIAKEPFGGPVVVKVGNSRISVGRGMASKINLER